MDCYGICMCGIYDEINDEEKCTIIKTNDGEDYWNGGVIVVRFQKYIRTPTLEDYESVKNAYADVANCQTIVAQYENDKARHIMGKGQLNREYNIVFKNGVYVSGGMPKDIYHIWLTKLKDIESRIEQAEEDLKRARDNFDMRLINKYFDTDGPYYIGVVDYDHDSCNVSYGCISRKNPPDRFLIPWYDVINWKYLMTEDEYYRQCCTLIVSDQDQDSIVETTFMRMYENMNYEPMLNIKIK